MRISVSAGHNPDGKIACGAIGLIKESTEARIVTKEVVRLLKAAGHTVHDCTVDDGTSQANVLKKIVEKHNSYSSDLDVSIHFNSGAGDKGGNGKTTGTEVLVYSVKGGAYAYAEKIVKAISELGFRNRGVKIRNDLYFLRKTTAPALLVECCFVDDKDDVNLYNAKKMAQAIVKGITGKVINADIPPATSGPSSEVKNGSFKVKVKVNALNIRQKPDASSPVVGVIKDKGIYTITQKIGNWGYLKSKAGYINVSDLYVNRLD